MLMFDNGILATFIPEILMVLGFLFCLIVPNGNSTNSNTDITPQIVRFKSVEQVLDTKTYIASLIEFQQADLSYIVEKQLIVYSRIIPDNESPEDTFEISDGLSFVQFSRPPPFLLS